MFFKPQHDSLSNIKRLFGEYKLIFFHSNEIEVAEELQRASWDPELFYTDENGIMHYDDPTVETLTGIDVSSFQKEVDWSAVKDSGIQFAFLRVGYRGNTEGGLFIDPCFEQNYERAKQNDIPVGVYFFSQSLNEIEATEEADYVLSIIKDKKIDLPIVYDWEYVSESARTANIDSKQMSACAQAFCDRIESAGFDSMVYFNLYTSYMIYDMNSFGDKSIWLAQFSDKPSYYYHYEIWQYSCTGSVPGIDAEVDLNIALDKHLIELIKNA